MGGSGYTAKNPRTPGGVKRSVGIILKKINAGPIGLLPPGKNKIAKTVSVFGPDKGGRGKLAQPIASALAGGRAVAEVRKLAKVLGPAAPTPPRAVKKPGNATPVAKKLIRAKKTG